MLHFELQDHDTVALLRVFGSPDEDGWQHVLRQIAEQLHKSQKRRVYVLDFLDLHGVTAMHRHQLAQWRTSVEADQRRTGIAFAYLIPSATMRGILTATFWIKKVPAPTRFFADLPSAVPWITEMLATENFSLPPSLLNAQPIEVIKDT